LGKFQPDDTERLAQKGSLFLVADGMGGHRSGELASRRAVDQVIRNYIDDPASDVGASLRRAIELANAALYAEAQRMDRDPTRRGWGTTLVAAVVRSGELWIANVGDSRAYLLRSGKVRQLSRDHVLYPAGEEDGTPAGKLVGRHVITRALGRKPNVEVDIFPPLELRDGDRVLLCSDGLTTPLPDEEICDIGSRYPPPKAAEALVQTANERGGPDNVSVIVIGIASRETTLGRDGRQNTPGAITSPDAWRSAVESIQQFISDGNRDFRSPVFLAMVLLVILVLIGLGFVLGLILF
jgi:protein phosphatase